MLPPKKTRDLARSLVACETDASTTSLQAEPATVRAAIIWDATSLTDS
jgi:hypothetical protein